MSKHAVIVIDIQKDYFPGGLWTLSGADAAADNAARIIGAAREAGDLVVHVRHEFTSPEAPFFRPGSEGAQIHPKVLNADGEPVVLKHFVNSFRETNLKEILTSLSNIANEVETKTPAIVGNVESFTTQLNVEMGKVDQLLSDRNIAAVETSLANIEQTTANAVVASEDMKALAAKITAVADEIKDLVADNRKSVDKSIADLEYVLRAVAQNIDSITRNLDGTTRNMNEFESRQRYHRIVEECMRTRGYGTEEETPQ